MRFVFGGDSRIVFVALICCYMPAHPTRSYSDDKYNVQFKYVPKEWPRTDTKVGTDELGE